MPPLLLNIDADLENADWPKRMCNLRTAESAGHEFHGNQWTGFHGTSLEAAESIKKTGLKPNSAGRLFAAKDLRLALRYASFSTAKREAGVVVLKPSAKKFFEEARIHKPTTMWFKEKVPGNYFEGHEHVPPEYIKEVRVYQLSDLNENKLDRYRTLASTSLEDDDLIFIFELDDEPRTAGDHQNHPFYGNQWTQGSGKQVEAKQAELKKQEQLSAAQTNPLAHTVAVLGLPGVTVRDSDVIRYVAAYGKEYKPDTRPEDIEQGTPQECYKNASLLLLEHPKLNLNYVEGFMYPTKVDLPVLHAWTVTPDGKVIDPTMTHQEDRRYFGIEYGHNEYLKYLYSAKLYGVLGSTDKNALKAIHTGGGKMRKQNIRTAEEAGHEFHGNQWTSGGEKGKSGTGARSYFHGTLKENVKALLEHGFDPERGEVYTTNKFEGALEWAEIHLEDNPDANGVAVLRISVPKDELSSVRRTDPGEFTLPMHVPPSWVQEVTVFEKDEHGRLGPARSVSSIKDLTAADDLYVVMFI